jgi:2-methylaconitate cis-trans-isomerase PrpF
MRGGTSKALMFHTSDLPQNRDDWAPIFLSAMGTPDPYGRQLDGMGGGISSVSKVCVVGAPTRADADVDFTFAQLGIDKPIVDYAGNCGNMSSAIGPFAVDEGLVPRPPDGMAMVRIHNTNTAKIIHAHFPVADGRTVFDGDFAIDGVAGHAAPIRLDFLDPEGAKTGKALPTGNAIDRFDIEGLGTIEASLVDAANPSVFIRARDLGLVGTELPDAIERSGTLLDTLERIRVQASIRMGMAADERAASVQASQPKIAMLAPAADMTSLSGNSIRRADHDILCRMISVGRPHRAVPITGALCLAAACCIPDTIAMEMLAKRVAGGDIRIAHPSGITMVAADVTVADGRPKIKQATIYRTARRLFEGRVFF